MTSLLFITAPLANHKSINRILLHLRDWQYSDGEDDNFHLVTTKNAYDLDLSSGGTKEVEEHKCIEETHPPIPISTDNAWAGASLEDVEGYCADLSRCGVVGANPGLFVVVDEDSLRNEECVLVEEVYRWEEDGTVRFWKMRVPWDQLFITWCQLDVANMSFEEMTEEVEEANDEEARKRMTWWTWSAIDDEDDVECPEREAAIEKLRRGGGRERMFALGTCRTSLNNCMLGHITLSAWSRSLAALAPVQ